MPFPKKNCNLLRKTRYTPIKECDMRGTLLEVTICAQTMFVIINVISCKIMYGINSMSHKIKKSNAKKKYTTCIQQIWGRGRGGAGIKGGDGNRGNGVSQIEQTPGFLLPAKQQQTALSSTQG